MKLSEIEALADAAKLTQGGIYKEEHDMTFNSETLEQMCQLIRQQHEALIRHQELTRPIDTTEEALAAYEEFNK
jgi:hypothetical protein